MLPLGSGSVCGATIPLPLSRTGDPSCLAASLPSTALLACCGLVPLAAHAQYEVDEEDSVWLRALIDVRVARGPSSRAGPTAARENCATEAGPATQASST